MTTYKVTVGADPELMLQDTKSGKFVSAHTYIPGTKEAPVGVPFGAIQVDGVSAEFNIIPAKSPEEWMLNIESVIKTLSDTVHRQAPHLNLVAAPTAYFTKDYFDLLPDKVKELGCEPDYNAWTGEQNPMPDANRLFRTGGGHIHVGWTEHADPTAPSHFFDCIQAAKQMDAALYMPSLLFDTDRERLMLYGKMGCFRPKTYGFEYRTLSNSWLKDPALTRWVYDQTVEAMHMLLNDQYDNHLDQVETLADYLKDPLKLKRSELLDYHDQLVAIGFPPLPEQYTEA